MVEKEGYLQKAKIADGGKKLRKNWSTSWIVLSSRKIEFYREPKQQALSNTKTGHKAESVDLYGAHIEWAKEKSSRKNVFQSKAYQTINVDSEMGRGLSPGKNEIDRLSGWFEGMGSCITRHLTLLLQICEPSPTGSRKRTS
ncbi:rho GTPase-activating protein 15-like [Nycticebus coucang]|uniref:rho GTPase-activating protein 15-like n=1 Tax=Nycticebus coucang TaxID=9470 RepID=UPI00234DFEAB|nr:rho GTPase-activating protein 15-like [Nycticebus coucang]